MSVKIETEIKLDINYFISLIEKNKENAIKDRGDININNSQWLYIQGKVDALTEILYTYYKLTEWN